HPKAEIVVGRAHHLGAWAHRLAPRIYDRLVGPIVEGGALRNVPEAAHDGNVFAPSPQTNAIDDGWRKHDHRLLGMVLAIASATVAAARAAVGAARSRRL
ncbi:MAG: hypothetical protein H0V02_02650, partial [Nocardioidaceae bacterium]|nr:hypothetical protein [Nocardioidaceae bacterium]